MPQSYWIFYGVYRSYRVVFLLSDSNDILNKTKEKKYLILFYTYEVQTITAFRLIKKCQLCRYIIVYVQQNYWVLKKYHRRKTIDWNAILILFTQSILG